MKWLALVAGLTVAAVAAGFHFRPRPSDLPYHAGLSWILARQGADGLWGDGAERLEGRPLGRAASTALALIAFHESGFSHLSRDDWDGKVVGPAIKAGLHALISDQNPDGTFRSRVDPILDQALATAAVADALGMTGSVFLHPAMVKAVDALKAMRQPDGTWGDATTTAWALRAVAFAELASDDPVDRYGFMGKAEAAEPRPPWADPDGPAPSGIREDSFQATLWASEARLKGWGVRSPRWNEWQARLRPDLKKLQDADGAWRGGCDSDLVRTSLGVWIQSVLYRYAPVFNKQ